ncbi:MAG: hypothetical protein LAO09_15600 [Acidobacteriia bacterium]|nr:hypothetical protein [Terriglobia bacterium]
MDKKNLVSAAAGIAQRNKRYVVWFYLLNVVFAWLGATGLGTHAQAIMGHSLYADKLLHGFDLAVLVELISRPEFGGSQGATVPATIFAVLFLLASLFFMPGVLLGYSSDHRISRDQFFRACGHNVWRFVRLFLFFAVIAGIMVSILSGIEVALAKAADQTSHERLPFFTHVASLAVIFLVLTAIRIWFDLAQTEVVLRDQGAVRKSVASGFRMMQRNLGRLLGSYVVIAMVALLVLVAGILLWHTIVPPASVLGAFLILQATLLLLLAMRFWQRAAAVAFYVGMAAEPAVESQPAAALASPSVTV